MAEEKYLPTDEELFRAENSLTDEQREMTKIREEGFALGERSGIDNFVSKRVKTESNRSYDPASLKQSITNVRLRSNVLTTQFQKAMEENGIKTVGDIINRYYDILRSHGFGNTMQEDLKEWLRIRGMSVRKTEDQMTHDAIKEKMDANIKTVNGEEMKTFFELEYNPDVLLIKVSNLESQITSLGNIGKWGKQSLDKLEDYLFAQFGIKRGMEIPMRVQEWYLAKLGMETS